jgi:putative copper resistance protein D
MRTGLLLAAGLAIIAVSWAAALALAYPHGAAVPALVRAVADCAAVATFGFAMVPSLDDDRHRAEFADRAAGPLATAGVAWLVAEVCRQVVAAAQATALPVLRLPAAIVFEFSLHTIAGRAGLVSIAAAAAVSVATLAGRRALLVVITGAVAIGIAARAVSGHLSGGTVGAVAVAAHALAAAAWCGGLAALLVIVRHRGRWARVLPRFSQVSMICVAILLASGVVSAVVVLDSPSQLYATGYGRVLSAKIALAAALLLLAWFNRSGWLPAARSHRATAQVSFNRSATEVAVMVVALTMAAALVVTG